MVVNCFIPLCHANLSKRNKQISCMLGFFSILCENAYIPAMGFLSRIHSSCAFNISFFLNLSERKGNIQSCHQHGWEMKSWNF